MWLEDEEKEEEKGFAEQNTLKIPGFMFVYKHA